MDITLRKWKKSDYQLLARFANNPKIASNLREGFPCPYTQKHAKGFINFCLMQDDALMRVIALDDKFIGSIAVSKIAGSDNAYEIGYWLAEEYWGHGIMSKAIDRICQMAFKQLKISSISACIFSFNYQSKRALEKSGFIFQEMKKHAEKKNGEYIDCLCYVKFN